MSDVLATAARWRAEGAGFGRATLVAAVGSAPFEVGSMLLAADDGRLAGSVSAGCVEGAAAEAILAARRGGYREVIHFGVSNERAAEVGLSCGGEIDVLIEPEVPAEILDAAATGRSVALVTSLPSGRHAPATQRILVEASGGHRGSLGDPAVDGIALGSAAEALRDGAARTVSVEGERLFVEVLVPLRLVIVGAGDIAVYLVRLAHAVGLHTVVIDPRAAFLTRERFPDADELIEGWADEVADRAGIDVAASVVALAHDPKIDDPALVTALRRGSRYVGALGSRRTHAQRVARLREAGLDDAEIGRIHAPVGLDLGGHTPPHIAIGILAETVAARHAGRPNAERGARPHRSADRANPADDGVDPESIVADRPADGLGALDRELAQGRSARLKGPLLKRKLY